MLGFIPFPSWIRPEIVPFLPVRWYGLMYCVAFAIAYLLLMRQIRERRIEVDKDSVLNLFFWGIIGILVGARAFAVIIYDPTGYYLAHPLQIVLPFAMVGGRITYTGIAGLSYHGGLVGGTVAVLAYLGVKKLDLLDWADMIVAGVPLGYTFGRMGNFINGELYGRITQVPWGIVFPNAQGFPVKEPWVRAYAAAVGMQVPATGLLNLPRHPSQLYEAFFEGIVLWLFLWFVARKKRPFRGFMLSCYLIGYGLVRFFIEYAREPDIGIGYPIHPVYVANAGQVSPWNFSTGQILCFLMIAAGLISLPIFRRIGAFPRESAPTGKRPSGRKLRKKIKGSGKGS